MNATSTQILSVEGINDVAIESTEEARHSRDLILHLAAPISKVSNPEEAESVAIVLRDAKAFCSLVEAARTAHKAPILDQGRKIDTLAKELSSAVEGEAKRIGQILGAFTAEQSRKAEEARQAAWKEEQRILREREEKERIEREKAEAQQRELERKQSVARNQENADKYAAEAEQRRIQAAKAEEARQAEMERQIIATRQQAASVAALKPAGISSRKVLKYEVTDIVALYEAAPMLVKMEVAPAALKEALKNLRPDQTLPGIKHWYEADVSVR